MLRPTLIALIAIVVFSSLVVDSNNSQCSPDDQDCAQFPSYEPSGSDIETTVLNEDQDPLPVAFFTNGELLGQNSSSTVPDEDQTTVLERNFSSTSFPTSTLTTSTADDRFETLGPDEDPKSDSDQNELGFEVSGNTTVNVDSSSTTATTQVRLIPKEWNKVSCVTPEGNVKDQKYCFYAIDVGDPLKSFRVYYNVDADAENKIQNPEILSLMITIEAFCNRDDNDGIVKSFPAYMARDTKVNGANVTILSDAWVHCCRYNCKSSLEAMSGKKLDPSNFTRRELVRALARSYIKAMPRTAMGLSLVKETTDDTCMTEDFMRAPKLPLVSNCHSIVYAAPSGDNRINSGRVLFNRISQSSIEDLFGDLGDRSVFAYYHENCPLSFNARESGFNNSYDTKCTEIATPRGFLRWCCCSRNMTQCAPRPLGHRDALLCVHGKYIHGDQTINANVLSGSQIKPLTAHHCHVIYQRNLSRPKVTVEMSPEYDVSHTAHFSDICQLQPSKALSCPHLLELTNSAAIEVECSCLSNNFCNHDMHYNKAEPLQNYKRRCKYASGFEHVFYEHLYTKNSTEYGGENEFFCPVYYDVGKRRVMNLVHDGNMRIRVNKTILQEIFINTASCKLVEIELNQDAFSQDSKCENEEQGYQKSDFGIPRLVIACTCSSNAYSRDLNRTSEYCDEEIVAAMDEALIETFESRLSQCMEAKSNFSVETFNSLDHLKNKRYLPNTETSYCYQAYTIGTGIMESGALTSKNTGLARECAVELAKIAFHLNEKRFCNQRNGTFLCCCFMEPGSKTPCNEFLVHTGFRDALLIEHKPPEYNCGSEYCTRHDMGCYVQRWASALSGHKSGCTSDIDGIVQADPTKRYLQACEIAENQRKCTAVSHQNGEEPVVMCCCKDGVCPEEKAHLEFGLVMDKGKP